MDVYIGFDSAWTDNPKAPGAICAIAIKDRQPLRFYAPQFVSFNQALTFIKSVSADDGVEKIGEWTAGAEAQALRLSILVVREVVRCCAKHPEPTMAVA